MVTEIEHKSKFIQDTENIIDRLNLQLTGKDISIADIYREIHSLKGAAGFAGLYNMEHLAHRLEGLLTNIKNGHISLNDEIEGIFYHTQNYFIKNLGKWKSEGIELDSSDLLQMVKDKSQYSAPLKIEVIEEGDKEESFFSEFEQDLLKEAMLRGDKFYKIVCHIDRDEEMKYPRLFLVVNNLEKIANVIKINPSLDEITKNRSREITVYLTTDKVKSEIYKGLNLDRIKEVELLRMDYNSFFNNEDSKNRHKEINLYGSTIDVETAKIEEIFNYAQDLHNKLLLDELVIPEKRGAVENLLSGMKNTLTSLTQITFNKAFSDFNQYCIRLAAELGKKVSFNLVGGEVTVERSTAEIIKELILQLVKNSVDHGIESPELREELGKNSEGSLKLTVSKVKNCLALSFEDDGKGIDRGEILKKGVEGNFIDEKEEVSLLSLLSQPGFSTSKEISHYSGRGVGLDIVVNRVINNLDGKIKVNNRPGKGLSFDIVIPPASLVKKYTIFKYRNRSFGFSKGNVLKKVTLNKDLLSVGENSVLSYTYRGDVYPVYTPFGRLSSNHTDLNEKYGFIVRYLGKKAFMPVEEFIIEKEFFSSVISYINTESPNHKLLKVADKVEDFTFVLPSIINF